MSSVSTVIARRQRDIARREQAMLDAAQALIQRDGLLSLQMARVAEESGYAIGTLYKHFASKEDLLVTLATRNSLDRLELFARAATCICSSTSNRPASPRRAFSSRRSARMPASPLFLS